MQPGRRGPMTDSAIGLPGKKCCVLAVTAEQRGLVTTSSFPQTPQVAKEN